MIPAARPPLRLRPAARRALALLVGPALLAAAAGCATPAVAPSPRSAAPPAGAATAQAPPAPVPAAAPAPAVADLDSRMQLLEAECARLDGELAQAQTALAAAADAGRRLQARADALSRENAGLAAQLAAVTRERDEARAQLQRLKDLETSMEEKRKRLR
jgi:septal ring factor EnvC (AmiA/AmiB activator)